MDNPTIPAMYDIAWTAVAAVAVVLLVAAVVSVLRTPVESRVAGALWMLGVILFPIIGPLAWFAVGRSAVRAKITR
ncbi:PLDc N-terminal domain-containing protein [Hoyosella rhizosphaerae]|uniref:Cardiolipin synthase N-terminal domain-containing protein n=1 Tax=Hoyosella rhizosphaerae TaxID=1755582 RepID=A0A916XEY4_9ACTN|nr:PLDc N-terminal domain-containing protein [Hoyosella rhizosphaerae]MBN4925906.1 PLDc N-terminal domain-containing protein [Hoyosella rhizosphaerae]GGC67029.1 hypothetical protein GCM10011410_19620 [Hoyosella rhizosphaerae]